MLQILLGLFAAYILYNFIFRFVIPLVRVTRQVKKQVKSFREQANAGAGAYQQGGFQAGGFQAGGFQPGGFQQDAFGSGHEHTNSPYGKGYGQNTAQTSTSRSDDKTRPKSDDYIDFEEVK